MNDTNESVLAPWQRTAWTVPALAGNWELPKGQVYELIRSGRLHAVRVGRHYLVPADEVSRFLAEGEAA